ncbi:MAG: ABC transporter permease [Candidatus Peribacteraceae bacterium]|nr:ABC transporter permease [Candidatus Peribacteraceae bacterium]MDD5742554.1 ABC transporter permease [Candidatus Peribacteraceae bacterium]
MNFFENILNALGAIGSNKMRSALTMLGIVIGVASVVLLVAIGQGAASGIKSQVQGLGTNLLSISPGSPNQTNVRFSMGSTSSLKSTDTDYITQYAAELLNGIEPELSSRQQLVAGNINTNSSVVGTVPSYLTVRNSAVEYGSFITEEHLTNVDKVAVLGPSTASTLFPDDADPLGNTFRIGNNIFTVIGILESKGSTGMTNRDDTVLIPLTTMQRRIAGKTSLSSISVSVKNESEMDYAKQVLTAILLNAHGITDTSKQDFTVLSQADAVETLNAVTSTLTYLLGGIAAISLIVGGIGVMNIMLVSVTERTREIGIRKAIGAKKRDIMTQFLVESTVLSILGGAIGILISVIGSWIVTIYSSLEATIALYSVFLAFGFSVCVGIFFGMLPAWKAAKLRPIEALRYE